MRRSSPGVDEPVAPVLAKLPQSFQKKLRVERVPRTIARWIARAPSSSERALRLAIVLRLRRESEYVAWRWPLPGEASAALALFRRWPSLKLDDLSDAVFDALVALHTAEVGRGVQVAPKHAAVLEQLNAWETAQEVVVGRVREIGWDGTGAAPVPADVKVVSVNEPINRAVVNMPTSDGPGGEEGRAG
jgi:hypothetical protein